MLLPSKACGQACCKRFQPANCNVPGIKALCSAGGGSLLLVCFAHTNKYRAIYCCLFTRQAQCSILSLLHDDADLLSRVS